MTSQVAPARYVGPTHLGYVEGLRALAAYVVYINHAFAQTWAGQDVPPLPSCLYFLTYSLVAGHLAVSVFIVISGFCLTLPVIRNGGELRDGVAAFLRRRARRILPPYYAAVAFCLLLIWTIIGKPTGTLWDFCTDVTYEAVIAHALLLQDLFATSHINYVFWSIAVECHIYLIFPALLWLWRRRGAGAAVLTALVVGYFLRLAFADTRIVRAAPHYFGLFAVGMLAAYIACSAEHRYVRMRERIRWELIAIAGLILVCVLCRTWGWILATKRFDFLDFPVGLSAMALLVHASSPSGRFVANALSWRPLAFIGTFSYSVYLIHAPLLQVVWQYIVRPSHLGPLSTFALLMGPGALLVLCVAYGFFRLFEQPFIRQPVPKRVLGARATTARFVA